MSRRDTQFAGFAILLLEEIDRATNWSARANVRNEQEFRESIGLIIARRAYDLVSHTLDNTGPMMIDCYSHEEQIAEIPDMAVWPHENSDLLS